MGHGKAVKTLFNTGADPSIGEKDGYKWVTSVVNEALPSSLVATATGGSSWGSSGRSARLSTLDGLNSRQSAADASPPPLPPPHGSTLR